MSSYCIGKPGVYLVTGGSRSGKSKFAERLVSQYDDVAYIATSVITDSEMERRVKKHKASRPNTWKVYEEPYDIKDVIAFPKNSAAKCLMTDAPAIASEDQMRELHLRLTTKIN